MEEKVSFTVSSTEPIAWHYASIKVALQEIAAIIDISTQGESSQTAIIKAVGPLRAIYYGSDKGNEILSNSKNILMNLISNLF